MGKLERDFLMLTAGIVWGVVITTMIRMIWN